MINTEANIKGRMVILLLFLVIGCGMPTAIYKISLQAVEGSADARKGYSKYEIATKQEGGMWAYIFEDDMVKISWQPKVLYTSNPHFDFTLLNKTDQSIEIMWEEATFVDEKVGQSHRIKYTTAKHPEGKSNLQYPNIVAPQGAITGFITVNYVFPRIGENIQSLIKPYIGRTYRVLLPLQIEDIVNKYIFTFVVDDVVVHRLE